MSKDNLSFWLSVEKTDPKHTKKVKQGARQITAINAQQQIKNATEKWGMYGGRWGLKDISLKWIEGLTNSQLLAVSQAVFYYPDGSFEIGSSIFVEQWISSKGYSKVDDDFLKKLETDMTTKALSKLGFNADVFLGKFDDNKYVTKMTQEFSAPKKPKKIEVGTAEFTRFKKAISEKKTTVEELRTKYGYQISKAVEEQLNK